MKDLKTIFKTLLLVICCIMLLSAVAGLPWRKWMTAEAAGYTDEFNSGTLDGAWSWVREDSANWSLTAMSGYMRIKTQGQDLWGSGGNTENILLRTPATGDWTILTKLAFAPTANYQQAGLIVYNNDDNYVKCVYGYDSAKGGTCIEYGKEIGGTATNGKSALTANPVYLKINKTNTTYTLYYSTDNNTWNQFQQYTGVNFATLKVGLLAQSTAGANADFDWFDLQTPATPTPLPTSTSTATATPTPTSTPTPSPGPILLSDDFNDNSIDTGKWDVIDKGLESNAVSGISASETNQQMKFNGSTSVSCWAGKSVRSKAVFSASTGTPLTVEVDRVSLSGSGTAYRSSIWLYVSDTQYLHVSQCINETNWSYNKDGGIGGGTAIWNDANTGLKPVKLVHDGNSVHVWIDGVERTEVTGISWNSNIKVMLTGQARASGDTVTAIFDNLKVTGGSPGPTPTPDGNFTNKNFETGNFTNWTTTGTAFGTVPRSTGHGSLNGWQGSYWGDSFTGGESATGTLRSVNFTCLAQITFLKAGWDGQSLGNNNWYYLKRASDGAVLLNARPPQSDTFTRQTWDTTAYTGQTVYLEVVDNNNSSAGFAWLAVDDIQAGNGFNLGADSAGTLRFYGRQEADLLTKEISETHLGVLSNNFISAETSEFPRGFVRASLPGYGWQETCWTRDTGTFLREATLWGDYEHAACTADYLMTHVTLNPEGYYTFPEYFQYKNTGSGTEMDGTAAIAIGMAQLWQRLPTSHWYRGNLYNFLHASSSPLRYTHYKLQSQPLIAGTGEFGGGCGIPGSWYNVVQNNLIRLALLIGADMEEAVGDTTLANTYRTDAQTLYNNMAQYLVNTSNNTWYWCISPSTLLPDWNILNDPINKGAACINGVGCMYSDAQGFDPVGDNWSGRTFTLNTFNNLYNRTLRKDQFDKYGIFAGWDEFREGKSAGPSYQDGYALQMMLLFDLKEMAKKSLRWYAAQCYKDGNPSAQFLTDLANNGAAISLTDPVSTYWFQERDYSPEFAGTRDRGCYKLNLVNTTEPLKVARLLLGADDTRSDQVSVLPRIPDTWQGVEAFNWPLRTSNGLCRADIKFENRAGGTYYFRIEPKNGVTIPKLRVRFPSGAGFVWEERLNVSSMVEITK